MGCRTAGVETVGLSARGTSARYQGPELWGTSSTGYSQWVLQALIPIEHRSERRAGNTSTTTDPSSAAANGAGEPSSLLGCRPAQRCDSAIAPERTRRGCAYILELEQADWTQIGLADDRQPPAIATVWCGAGLAWLQRPETSEQQSGIGAALGRHWRGIGIGIESGSGSGLGRASTEELR